jgi:hypothetical protein
LTIAEFAGSHALSMNRKPLNMGIAEVKLRQRDLGILSLGTMEEREWKL